MRPSRKPSVAKSDPCTALTPQAIQDIIDKIAESGNMAKKNLSSFPADTVYGPKNLLLLRRAHKNMTDLQNYLKRKNLASPYVTNASAAYNVNQYSRKAIAKLIYAQHWGQVTATNYKSKYARESYELTWEAIALANALALAAGRCYMKGYFP